MQPTYNPVSPTSKRSIVSLRLIIAVLLLAVGGFLIYQDRRSNTKTVAVETPPETSNPSTGSGQASDNLPAGEAETPKEKTAADKFLDKINEYRAGLNLGKIEVEQSLCKLAVRRAEEVVVNWSQRSFTDNKIELAREFCPKCKKMTESVAREFNDPQEIFDQWIKMKDTKANIEGDYDVGCIVIYSKKEQNYLVMELGQLK